MKITADEDNYWRRRGGVMYRVGVFRKGKLLFALGGLQPTYAAASLAVMIVELANPPLVDGDYVACEEA